MKNYGSSKRGLITDRAGFVRAILRTMARVDRMSPATGEQS